MMKKNRTSAGFMIGIFLVSLLWALFAGNSAISTKEIIQVLIGKGTSVQQTILFRVRIPRIVAAAFTGAALSVSGFLLQNSLNNVLASPGILGIHNGAGLFVLLYAWLFPYRYAGKGIAAFLGALLVTAVIYLLTTKTGISKTSVVLSGVAISALCLSGIDMIISLKPETVADRTAFSLGGFGSLNSTAVWMAVPVIVIVLFVSILTAPALDLMLLGDEVASGLGLSVRRYRILHITCAALLSGAAVSMCGIIGFVGLIVPNVVRLFYRGKSRGALLFVVLLGAEFLLICDTLGRVLFFPYELPCGLFLSLIGAPFLIWMLIRRRKRLGVK